VFYTEDGNLVSEYVFVYNNSILFGEKKINISSKVDENVI